MSEELAGITVRQDHVSVRAKLRSRLEIDWAINMLSTLRNSMFPQPSKFDVILVHHGERKINVIKEIRACAGIGLKEAKDLSEQPNSTIVSGVEIGHAGAVRNNLVREGAEALIVDHRVNPDRAFQ